MLLKKNSREIPQINCLTKPLFSTEFFYSQKNCDKDSIVTKTQTVTKTQIVTKLKNSSCDRIQKSKMWQKKLKMSNCDKTQKLKFWQNWNLTPCQPMSCAWGSILQSCDVLVRNPFFPIVSAVYLDCLTPYCVIL